MSKTSIVAEPNKQEVIISRTFEAPRELVFRMWTDAKYLPEWWGPSVMTTIVDSLDAKKGGVWRYVQRDPAGNEYAHNGVFHEITAPERLVHTYEFEGVPSVGLVTVTFEELPGGKTKLTETSLYPSVEIRDGVLQSGMTEGAIELMDRFAVLLAKHSL
ncbi:SRPBCC family protein [Paenibacillus sp. GCM10027626]|uniref:SRPBCC family protein n=1 Tax=Paenibacillus sp. GCM10027626 TaxID=3273411 RepID=UPI003632EA83